MASSWHSSALPGALGALTLQGLALAVVDVRCHASASACEEGPGPGEGSRFWELGAEPGGPKPRALDSPAASQSRQFRVRQQRAAHT